jgi:cysteine-rich repeat protein
MANEECDTGPENSDTKPGACRTTCALAGCGDKVLDSGEACDDGNRLSGDGCAASCRKIEQCGDGILDPGAELCDDGANNSDTLADRCRTNCTTPRCGDGTEDREEECDDGNLANADNCDSNCTRPRCGNHVTGAGEDCDDGNTFNADACLSDCRANRCTGGVDGDGNPCFVLRTLSLEEDSDPRAVEIADLDGDGRSDIAVVDRDDDTVKVFWNNGGSFKMVQEWVGTFSLTSDHPVDVAIGDINADGKLDLVTANESKDRVCVLENKGSRSFDRHFIDVPGQPTDVTLADIDSILGAEIVVGLDDDDEVRIIRTNGFFPYGTPQALPASSPQSLAAGDADGDGDADICWESGSPVVAVNDSGLLAKNSIADAKSTASARLWNLDDTPQAELVTGVYGLFSSEYLRVFANTDTTNTSVFDTYADVPVTEWPVYLARWNLGVAYADDGGHFAVLRNDQGALVDERLFTYDGDSQGLASGDLDKDGAPDLVIISKDKKAVLLFMSSSS